MMNKVGGMIVSIYLTDKYCKGKGLHAGEELKPPLSVLFTRCLWLIL